MSKVKIFLLILLVFLVTAITYFVINKKPGSPVSPEVAKMIGIEEAQEQPTSSPVISTYNPPKEINYGSSTDLKAELESINPQVLDSDFE